jgi:hypothetical protein
VIPDGERPYAVVGIVAFDLQATRLHYVLGTQEPQSNTRVQRPGRIPAQDMQAGKLLAVLNGGFKAEHGQYGVMVEGVTLLKPRTGNITVGVDRNDSLRMGVWDQDLVTDDLTWWRQNGLPLIHKGKINPLAEKKTTQKWGAYVDGTVAVYRSGLGMSEDGRILYFAAGDSLLALTLAQALKAAGAHQAMQLDINNYWVYFGKVLVEKGQLTTKPLLPKMKRSEPKRYLGRFSRDFFYITARESTL